MSEPQSTAVATRNPSEMGLMVEDRAGSYLPILPSKEELEILQTLAQTAQDSKFYNQLGGLNGVMSIMLYARELGCPPMIAISGGFWNIQGKVEMSARMMAIRVRQSGHILNIKEATDKKCTIYGKRRDTHEEHEVTFTIEMAQKMKVIKSGGAWETVPDDMLYARAMSRLARRLFPDIIGSAYSEGEVSEAIDVDFTIPKEEPHRRGRGKAKPQTVLTPQEAVVPQTEEVQVEENAGDPGPAAEESPAPEELTGAQEAQPTGQGEIFPGDQQSEAPLVEPSPVIVKTLTTLFNYLGTKYHLNDKGLGYARELLRGEFAVKEPELIPESHLEALKKFCNTNLLRELQQENYIPMTIG